MKIVKITKLAPELTVDIEVADTHSYQLGNGVVSHNTTSKLFGLTEGAHLPAKRYYLRWVQFRADDPVLVNYRATGYPVKDLQTYKGTTIVGFPTVPAITKMGMGEKLITASEASPDAQYAWLRLLERHWLGAGRHDLGGQVSYTLKYDPKQVTFEAFRSIILRNQPTVRCCSVLPEVDKSAYEYLPEQEISEFEFNLISARIRALGGASEAIGEEHLQCASGGCPL